MIIVCGFSIIMFTLALIYRCIKNIRRRKYQAEMMDDYYNYDDYYYDDKNYRTNKDTNNSYHQRDSSYSSASIKSNMNN